MSALMLFAGIGLLAGGALVAWSSLGMRRRGASWRGLAIAGAAFALDGVLVLTGVIPHRTWGVGAGFMLAGVIWTGALLQFRDNRKA